MTGYHVLLRCPNGGEETCIVYVSDMDNTATTYTDAGTDLNTRYRYRVKAKIAHCPNDVSNFAQIDTRFLSGNTASATMCHVTVHAGRHNSTPKNAAHHPRRCTIAGATHTLRRA